MSPDLDALSEEVRGVLDDKNAARERGLQNSRKVIRLSANAIRSLHRGEGDAAAQLMDEAAALLEDSPTALANHPDILFAGFVSDSAKEYAEARLKALPYATLCIQCAEESERPS